MLKRTEYTYVRDGVNRVNSYKVITRRLHLMNLLKEFLGTIALVVIIWGLIALAGWAQMTLGWY